MPPQDPQKKLKQLENQLELQTVLLKNAKQMAADSERYLAIVDNVNKAEQALARQRLEMAIENEESEAVIRSLANALETQTQNVKDSTQALKEEAAATAKLAENKKAAAGEAKNLKKSLFGLSGTSEKLGAIAKNVAGDFDAFKGELFKTDVITGALTKVIGTFVNQTINLAKEQDKAISDFRRATGATAEYNTQITQAERRNFLYGVSAIDAGKATQTLFTNFSNFTTLTEGEKAGLIDTTAVLQKLGVDASLSGKLMDQAMRASGKSASEANDLILDLAGSAQGLGVTMQQMTSDFEANFGELAKYGDNAIEVFKGLAVQAKNTGLEVSSLVKIASQFDKFDSAGQAVGRLNAILGGPYLNSIDMLNATEEERIEILSRSVEASGRQFDALNRFEQQAIASAMGTSVEEAQRLFNMSDAQYQLDAIKQEEAQELARETQTMMEELKSAMMALAVDMRPIIDGVIKPMIGAISKMAKGIGEGTNALGMFVKIGMVAAGIAALIAAPFTGGMSLGAYATFVGTAGLMAGGLAGIATSMVPGGTSSGEITPSFAEGGTITTEQAVVHPGELLVTGGQGSQVITAEKFQELIDSVKQQNRGNQQIAVYVGQEKIDELVVKGLDSDLARSAISPFTNAGGLIT